MFCPKFGLQIGAEVKNCRKQRRRGDIQRKCTLKMLNILIMCLPKGSCISLSMEIYRIVKAQENTYDMCSHWRITHSEKHTGSVLTIKC